MAFDDILDAGQMRDDNYNYRPAPADYTADSGSRLANYIIDYFARMLFFFLLMLFEETYNEFFDEPVSGAFMGFMLIIGWLGYYPILEYTYGKTVGKMITKTSVISINGNKASFLQILGRSLARLIPFEPFSFLGSRAIGWHDSLSDTRVVKDVFLVHNRNYQGEEGSF